MNGPINELFTLPTFRQDLDWAQIVADQHCPYLQKGCIKTRKSQPEQAIGTCSIRHGARHAQDLIICPHRFLSAGQVFFDCLHLLTLHEPGNELHTVPEVQIPGGSVDYFLVSVRAGQVVDFVGVELQALDTSGTLWPARQAFLESIAALDHPQTPPKPFGINWRMTAKTTLVQLHHKLSTLEGLGKHLVLVLQDQLLHYMQREFNFSQVNTARMGQPMHFHSYHFERLQDRFSLSLQARHSTDANGLETALGMQVSPSVELEAITRTLQQKLSPRTRLRL